MELLVSLIAFAMISIVAGIGSSVVVIELSKEVGPNFTARMCRVLLILFTLGGIALGSAMGLPPVAGGAIALLCGAVSSFVYTGVVRRDLQQQFALAASVEALGLRHFDTLDKNGDGVIDAIDLSRAVESGRFSKDDNAAFELMRRRISQIGHVTGVRPVVTTMAPTASVICTWGINRQDLQSYQSRLEQRYKSWRPRSTPDN